MKKIIPVAALFFLAILSCSNGWNDLYNERNGVFVVVQIAGGSFQRDATATNLSTVSSFYMSKTEVTRGQFTSVTGLADPSDPGYSLGIDNPVQNVNWYHALVFCNSLSMLQGLDPVYTIAGSTNPLDWISASGGVIPLSQDAIWNAVIVNWSANGYRLPTEMEWMWAAMGGASDSRTGDIVGGINRGGYTKGYAGSTETGGATINIGNYAWYSSNSGVYTHSIEAKLSNELGLYDMSGNVLEWCWDYDASYPSGSLVDYRGGSGTNRILRGGGFGTLTAGLTAAFRSSFNPSFQASEIGFRVVRN